MIQKISLPLEILDVKFFNATEKEIGKYCSGDNFGDYVEKN